MEPSVSAIAPVRARSRKMVESSQERQFVSVGRSWGMRRLEPPMRTPAGHNMGPPSGIYSIVARSSDPTLQHLHCCACYTLIP
eukprot:scaffold19225_cov107-Isochrysis_galbana.AAC.1